jgi:diguanylate cyclase (GGDEF)-like protein
VLPARSIPRTRDAVHGVQTEIPGVRFATFVALAAGISLLVGSIGLAVRDRSEKRLAVDHALTNQVDNEGAKLDEYFERARSVNLLTAHNPGFHDFYAAPGRRLDKVKAHGPAIRSAEAALAYLERLYPNSIGEACFIDRDGAENARYVRGVRAKLKDLSPDESGNPFFQPTFALRTGQVYQAQPYVSPDTHEWVISNSTPVPGTGYPASAIVHFEITLESFRREAASIGGDSDVAIVDARTGKVVVDSRSPQRLGAPLGRPADRRFVKLAAASGSSGTATIGGHRAAFQRLRATSQNANDWFVVAVDPKPVGSLLSDTGWAPFGLAVAAFVLLLLAGVSFRSSRRVLHDAAHSDALTGLRNRRQLIADLQAACERASKGERFVLVLYDLDGFKGYNDSFGHLLGDALLRRLASKLAQAIGDWGCAYRLGGDEFCVVVPLRGELRVDLVAGRGAEALSEDGEGFAIRASYGAVVLPDEARDASELLATADLRMYARKQRGRSSAGRQTTDVLVRVQHEKSPLLGPHVSAVGRLAAAVGQAMGLSESRLHVLAQAAELHDVGKMAIPDAVLEKEGPLTEDEWRLIREHTIVGERILSAAPALRAVAGIVRASHERIDGDGYPDRLEGEEIPLEARIVHTADAFCAMTADRPYRKARSLEGALNELRRCAGTEFDPAVVDALVSVIPAHDVSVREEPALAARSTSS